jgi:hypothetical protein
MILLSLCGSGQCWYFRGACCLHFYGQSEQSGKYSCIYRPWYNRPTWGTMGGWCPIQTNRDSEQGNVTNVTCTVVGSSQRVRSSCNNSRRGLPSQEELGWLLLLASYLPGLLFNPSHGCMFLWNAGELLQVYIVTTHKTVLYSHCCENLNSNFPFLSSWMSATITPQHWDCLHSLGYSEATGL